MSNRRRVSVVAVDCIIISSKSSLPTFFVSIPSYHPLPRIISTWHHSSAKVRSFAHPGLSSTFVHTPFQSCYLYIVPVFVSFFLFCSFIILHSKSIRLEALYTYNIHQLLYFLCFLIITLNSVRCSNIHNYRSKQTKSSVRYDCTWPWMKIEIKLALYCAKWLSNFLNDYSI